MKRLIFPALLLISTAAHATKVSWTGTIDGRSDQASGSYEYSGDLLWSMDLNVGPQHYIFPSQYFSFGPNGPLALSDVPLVDDKGNSGDLQWNISSWWFGRDDGDYVGKGNILNFSRSDAAPTPEPSTFVLFGSALLGFGLLRRRRGNC